MKALQAINPLEREASKLPDRIKGFRSVFTIEEIIKPYQTLNPKEDTILDDGDKPTDCCEWRYREFISKFSLPVLRPGQIRTFLSWVLSTAEEDMKITYATGTFVSRLIQASYEAGHNNFKLGTYTYPVSGLCYKLNGARKKPINVEVYGDVGHFFGMNSEYCNFKVSGKGGWHLGRRAKHCEFTTSGKIDICAGQMAEHSKFEFKDDVQSIADCAKSSHFILRAGLEHSPLASGMGLLSPENCVFHAKGQLYEYLKEQEHNGFRKGNKVVEIK